MLRNMKQQRVRGTLMAPNTQTQASQDADVQIFISVEVVSFLVEHLVRGSTLAPNSINNIK